MYSVLRIAIGFFLITASGTLALTCDLQAQTPRLEELGNGDMEATADGVTPEHWSLGTQSGSVLELESENPFTGQRAALLDSTDSDQTGGRLFTNLMQVIDGQKWRGKTVRFRAALRTGELEDSAQAQLWFRVDRPDGEGGSQSGAFDNMQNRPVRDDNWQHYEIVLRVDDDAERLLVGMFLIGRGKAWLDDVTLEVVPDDTPTTDDKTGRPAREDKESAEGGGQASRFQFPPALMKAIREAENAPQQPFFSPWLWLGLITVFLFSFSFLTATKTGTLDEPASESKWLSILIRFALRFSVAYWLLYSLPAPFSALIPGLGAKLASWHSAGVNQVVPWVADHVFGIDDELVPPNGSGDTTFNYINVFMVFILAIAIALVWSLVDRRKTEYRCVKDLLRSYLRYVLAFTMLMYGLIKISWDSNQFPLIGEMQLQKTWGDSSPMNVLWSFMGSSRPYTVFAGMGEVAGCLLLLFRRTTMLGALVVLGVMINVMMLNYCYDVPVKLYSTHLVGMALFLLLPECGRLANFMFWNRSTEPVDLSPPYTGPKTIWIQRIVKLAILVIGVGIPVYSHVSRQIDYFAEQAQLPEYFGTCIVEEIRIDGNLVSAADNTAYDWQTVKFQRLGYNLKGQRQTTNWMTIRMTRGGNSVATFSVESDSQLAFDDHQVAVLPLGTAKLEAIGEGKYRLIGESESGKVEFVLSKQAEKTTRLTGRGYRWINEAPFNR